jgi:hypothetical protein
MSPLARGVVVAVVQVALLAGVGAKLLYDRATLPSAWIETAGIDPDLPIRGRYVALNLVPPVVTEGTLDPDAEHAYGRVEVREGRAVGVLRGDAATPDDRHSLVFVRTKDAADARWRTLRPVVFFLAEHASDPTLGRRPGELWVEATLPPAGEPRPVRLGLHREGRIEPLH